MDILPVDTYSTIFDFRHTTFIVHGQIAWIVHTALFLTSDTPLSLSVDILPGLYIQHYFWRQIYHLACPWTHCPDYTFSTIFDFRYTSFIVHGHIPWTLYTALFLTSDIQLWMSMDILPGLYTQHSFWLQIYHFHCSWTYCLDYTHGTLFDFRDTTFIVHWHIAWTIHTTLFLTSAIILGR